MVESRKGKASVMNPDLPRDEQIKAMKLAAKQCYCGLGPACEIWAKMTPEERADCSRDKRAFSQLLWRHGVVR